MTLLSRIKPTELHWAVAIALAWGAIVLASGVLRLDPYGIEEGAARALLIIWSLSDRVISTAFVMGIPDLRGLIYLPLGLYWPGSILAAKVYTLILVFIAIFVLYRWQKRHSTAEAALISSGLLLIMPGLIAEIDRLGTGTYLLLCLATGHWLDRRYRRSERPLGGWYFLQILLVGLTVSLHPAGLAYPLALAWGWYRSPVDRRQQRHIHIGIVLALVFVAVLGMAWGTSVWLQNPLAALAQGLFGPAAVSSNPALVVAGLMAILLGVLAFLERRRLADDLLGLALVLASLTGLVSADGTWALLALAMLVHLGVPRLLALNDVIRGHGFLPKRGIAFGIVFIASLLFMQANKAHYLINGRNQMVGADEVIETLAAIVHDKPSDKVVVMSQWPGKTMLVLRRPVLPLPPPYPSVETLEKNLSGISHIVFDPFSEANARLKQQLSQLSERTETLDLTRYGAIIAIRAKAAARPADGPATDRAAD